MDGLSLAPLRPSARCVARHNNLFDLKPLAALQVGASALRSGRRARPGESSNPGGLASACILASALMIEYLGCPVSSLVCVGERVSPQRLRKRQRRDAACVCGRELLLAVCLVRSSRERKRKAGATNNTKTNASRAFWVGARSLKKHKANKKRRHPPPPRVTAVPPPPAKHAHMHARTQQATLTALPSPPYYLDARALSLSPTLLSVTVIASRAAAHGVGHRVG
jgi:hypothetical protein